MFSIVIGIFGISLFLDGYTGAGLAALSDTVS